MFPSFGAQSLHVAIFVACSFHCEIYAQMYVYMHIHKIYTAQFKNIHTCIRIQK